MSWQVTLISWAVLQLPIGICIGKAIKRSSFDVGTHPLVERAGLPFASPAYVPAGANNSQSALASATRADMAAAPGLADPSVAAAINISSMGAA